MKNVKTQQVLVNKIRNPSQFDLHFQKYKIGSKNLQISRVRKNSRNNQQKYPFCSILGMIIFEEALNLLQENCKFTKLS